MAIITVVTDVTFEEPEVDVEPVEGEAEADVRAGVAEEDDVPAGVAEEEDVPADFAEAVETPANALFRLLITLTGVYVDKSKGRRNSPRSQNFLAKAIVPRNETKFFSHSDHS